MPNKNAGIDRSREANLEAQLVASKNGHVSLELKEQTKLDAIAAEYIGSQQRLQQAQQALGEAQQAVEQQKGRIQGALEAILDRRDLDPATHRWDYDGKTVTLRAV